MKIARTSQDRRNISRRGHAIRAAINRSKAHGQGKAQGVGRRQAGRALSAGFDVGADGWRTRTASSGRSPIATARTWCRCSLTTACRVPRAGRSPGALASGSDRGFERAHAKGVDLYLHQQGLDTSTPSGRAMFQMKGYSPNSSAPSSAGVCCPASPAPRQKASRSAGRRSRTATPIR